MCLCLRSHQCFVLLKVYRPRRAVFVSVFLCFIVFVGVWMGVEADFLCVYF